MQQDDGYMKQIEHDELIKLTSKEREKVLSPGEYFKIKKMYYKVDAITTDGFRAIGVTKKEFLYERC